MLARPSFHKCLFSLCDSSYPFCVLVTLINVERKKYISLDCLSIILIFWLNVIWNYLYCQGCLTTCDGFYVVLYHKTYPSTFSCIYGTGCYRCSWYWSYWGIWWTSNDCRLWVCWGCGRLLPDNSKSTRIRARGCNRGILSGNGINYSWPSSSCRSIRNTIPSTTSRGWKETLTMFRGCHVWCSGWRSRIRGSSNTPHLRNSGLKKTGSNRFVGPWKVSICLSKKGCYLHQ